MWRRAQPLIWLDCEDVKWHPMGNTSEITNHFRLGKYISSAFFCVFLGCQILSSSMLIPQFDNLIYGKKLTRPIKAPVGLPRHKQRCSPVVHAFRRPNIAKNTEFRVFTTFRAPGLFFPIFFYMLFLFSLLFTCVSPSCFSSVHIVGSLTSGPPSINHC